MVTSDNTTGQPRSPDEAVPDKKLWLSYLLALPPHGIFGAHNYYLGRRRMGIVFSCTLGLLTLGWIVDLMRMRFLVKRSNDHIRKNKTDPFCLDDAYLAWFPLGLLGVHRFYLGDWIIGVVFFITLSAFTFGWWFDACFLKILVKVSQIERDRAARRAAGGNAEGGESNPAYQEDEHAPPSYNSIFGLMTRRFNNISRSNTSTNLEQTEIIENNDHIGSTQELYTADETLPPYQAVIHDNFSTDANKAINEPPPEYSQSEHLAETPSDQSGISHMPRDQTDPLTGTMDQSGLFVVSSIQSHRPMTSQHRTNYPIAPPSYDSIFTEEAVTHM